MPKTPGRFSVNTLMILSVVFDEKIQQHPQTSVTRLSAKRTLRQRNHAAFFLPRGGLLLMRRFSLGNLHELGPQPVGLRCQLVGSRASVLYRRGQLTAKPIYFCALAIQGSTGLNHQPRGSSSLYTSFMSMGIGLPGFFLSGCGGGLCLSNGIFRLLLSLLNTTLCLNMQTVDRVGMLSLQVRYASFCFFFLLFHFLDQAQGFGFCLLHSSDRLFSGLALCSCLSFACHAGRLGGQAKRSFHTHILLRCRHTRIRLVESCPDLRGGKVGV